MCYGPCCHEGALVVCHGRCETYIGRTGVVSRLNPEDGEIIWTADLGSITLSRSTGADVVKYRRAVSAAVSDDAIFVAWDLGPHASLDLQYNSLTPTGSSPWTTLMSSGGLAKLDLDGIVLWTIQFPKWYESSPNHPQISRVISGTEEFSGAASVAIDTEGAVWVATTADENNDYVYRIDPADGSYISKFGHAHSFSFPNPWPSATGRSRIERESPAIPSAGIVFVLPDGKIVLQNVASKTMIRMDATGAVEFADTWDVHKANFQNYLYQFNAPLGFVPNPFGHTKFAITGSNSLVAASPLGVRQGYMYQPEIPSIAGGPVWPFSDYPWVGTEWPWFLRGLYQRPSDWFNANYYNAERLLFESILSPALINSIQGMSLYPIRKFSSYVEGHPGSANDYGDDPLYDWAWRASPYAWQGIVEAQIDLPADWSAAANGGIARTWDWNDQGTNNTFSKTSLAATGDYIVLGYANTNFQWAGFGLTGNDFNHTTRWDPALSAGYTSFWNVFAVSETNGSPEWAYVFGLDFAKPGANFVGTYPTGTAIYRLSGTQIIDVSKVSETTVDCIAPVDNTTVVVSVNTTDWMYFGQRVAFGAGVLGTYSVYEVSQVIDSNTVRLKNLAGGIASFSIQDKRVLQLSGMCALDDGVCIVGGTPSVRQLVVERVSTGGQNVWWNELQRPSTGASAICFAVAFGEADE